MAPHFHARIPVADIRLGVREIDAVTRVLKSQWLTMGAVTAEFEAQAARYLNVRHAVAVSSGTAALHLAHQALGLGPGDEVLCPSLTFVATANAILYTGATPVFVDIEGPEELNMSVRDLESKITPRSRAITVLHYGGYPAAMQQIGEIAAQHNLEVIEDAAHALGASSNSTKAGTLGRLGCFSFFSNKNMTTGEGGMVVTDDDALAARMRLLRSHCIARSEGGLDADYDVVGLGYNYRIDELRSALGIVQLEGLERNNERRKALVEGYLQRLGELDGITIPFARSQSGSAHHLFPVVVKSRENLRDALRAELGLRGIETSVHFPPVHRLQYYRSRYGARREGLKQTDYAGDRLISLPLYPHLTLDQVDQVTSAIVAFLER